VVILRGSAYSSGLREGHRDAVQCILGGSWILDLGSWILDLGSWTVAIAFHLRPIATDRVLSVMDE